MSEPILPPLKPIPIKDRISVAYVEKGNVDVLDGAFVVVDKNGVRTHIPVGGLVCIMLEPGTRVSHAAVTLASRVGCLLVWVGDGHYQNRDSAYFLDMCLAFNYPPHHATNIKSGCSRPPSPCNPAGQLPPDRI